MRISSLLQQIGSLLSTHLLVIVRHHKIEYAHSRVVPLVFGRSNDAMHGSLLGVYEVVREAAVAKWVTHTLK